MIDFVAGDTGAFLRVQCINAETGEPLPLTDATVTLRWRFQGLSIVERTMTVTDSANGRAEYHFAAGDLVAGQMGVQVQLALSSGTLTALERGVFTVRAAL